MEKTKTMIVKNITSNIKPEKTIMEIEEILSKFGAKAILKDYEGGNVTAISFYIEYKNQRIPFKLPMSLEKARKVVEKAVEEKKLGYKFLEEPFRSDKARIVGWRIIKDWIHSQLSLLEIEFANPIEIFLPYAYNMFKKKTLYEIFSEEKDKFVEFKGENNNDS